MSLLNPIFSLHLVHVPRLVASMARSLSSSISQRLDGSERMGSVHATIKQCIGSGLSMKLTVDGSHCRKDHLASCSVKGYRLTKTVEARSLQEEVSDKEKLVTPYLRW